MAFHVPKRGRVLSGPLGSHDRDGNNGAFVIDSCEPGWLLVLIASDGSDWDEPSERWEHVSIHAFRRNANGVTRIPTWKEMCFVKRECWDAEDVVIQFHPRESEYVNNHADVLHLWRPVNATIPEPPSIFVGVKEEPALTPSRGRT